MSKIKFKTALPTVLFVSGIVGIFVSEIMVGRDTLKAEKVLAECEIECGGDAIKDKLIYGKDVATATWKCYIPTIASTIATLALLISSKKLTAKQIAALSAAVASGAELVGRYRGKIKEHVSEEMLHKIDSEVAQAQMVARKPVNIYTPGVVGKGENFESSDLDDGEYWFYDPFTNMKFKHTKLGVLGAKYYLNRNFALGGCAPLAMFYAFLGLTIPEEYESVCWDITENEFCWVDIEVVRSNDVDPETGEEYYIIEYPDDPQYPKYGEDNPIDKIPESVRDTIWKN